ncbi:MAG: outer membrane lipoprotein-sorting protein [Myxococcota bacterium]
MSFATTIALSLALAPAAPSQTEMVKMLRTIDERTGATSDYKAQVYIEEKETKRKERLYEAIVYRRDQDNKLMILFVRPKSEAGKGYLRLDANLFTYDPSVGRWERRTERERIAGTNSRRQDFDERRLADEFVPEFVGMEKLGDFKTVRLKLTAKKNAEVAYPVVELWIDPKSGNMLKQEEYAWSGKLLRTSYYPKWGLAKSKSGEEVYYPRETRVFDELKKGVSTTLIVRQVDLDTLPTNIFTKAWLESKSR